MRRKIYTEQEWPIRATREEAEVNASVLFVKNKSGLITATLVTISVWSPAIRPNTKYNRIYILKGVWAFNKLVFFNSG